MQSARENNIVALPDSAATMTKEEADGTARFPSSEACLPRAENTAAVARARSASALSRKRGSRHTHGASRRPVFRATGRGVASNDA